MNMRYAIILMLVWAGTLPVGLSANPERQADQQAPQIASYKIDAQLDPAAKMVTGSERITYRNPSQAALPEVWLRLYLRAFRDLNTLWMRESGGKSRGFAIQPSELGDITVASLKIAGVAFVVSIWPQEPVKV